MQCSVKHHQKLGLEYEIIAVFQFLERRGEVRAEEIPSGGTSSHGDVAPSFSGSGGGPGPDLGLHQRQRLPPGSLGEAYRPVGGGGQHHGGGAGNEDFHRQFLEAAQRRRVEEAEEADVNASMHGNWTMENAKSKLNMWMQENRIKADYRYSTMGPEHNRSFVAEMKIYVKQLGREVAAR